MVVVQPGMRSRARAPTNLRTGEGQRGRSKAPGKRVDPQKRGARESSKADHERLEVKSKREGKSMRKREASGS